jgi:hypothetical protein
MFIISHSRVQPGEPPWELEPEIVWHCKCKCPVVDEEAEAGKIRGGTGRLREMRAPGFIMGGEFDYFDVLYPNTLHIELLM